MKGSVIAAGIAAVLDIAINYVSDNLKNPWAWLIFIIVVVVSAMVGNSIEKRVAQKATINGESNDIEQTISGEGTQTATVKGKNHKIKQEIKL